MGYYSIFSLSLKRQTVEAIDENKIIKKFKEFSEDAKWALQDNNRVNMKNNR